jgi:hypothetical protein
MVAYSVDFRVEFFRSDLDQSPYLGSKSFESLIQITKYGFGNLVLLTPFIYVCLQISVILKFPHFFS